MSLPHLLLGLLNEKPRTGYELESAINEELDPFWRAGFSQIYPALARMRRAGWVLLRVLGPRRGPPRLLYRATAAGRRELRRWLEDAGGPPRGNDASLARLAFADALEPAARRRLLRSLDDGASAEITRLRALPEPDGARGLARRAAIEELEARRRAVRAVRRP
ncbi:MAG TPA: PadR family transcriptional regulator [Thermoanaerobaculia bacterium]|jgi:DNA-binding PadR family transcriptional regulator|nr:PadR family transcriptional regulator [Thermoanaerobaculia bacterium]